MLFDASITSPRTKEVDRQLLTNHEGYNDITLGAVDRPLEGRQGVLLEGIDICNKALINLPLNVDCPIVTSQQMTVGQQPCPLPNLRIPVIPLQRSQLPKARGERVRQLRVI